MAIEQDVEHFIVGAERSINQRDMAAYGRLSSEDLAMRAPGVPGEAMGREARVQFVQGILKTFPDGRIERVRAFGQGDRLHPVPVQGYEHRTVGDPRWWRGSTYESVGRVRILRRRHRGCAGRVPRVEPVVVGVDGFLS